MSDDASTATSAVQTMQSISAAGDGSAFAVNLQGQILENSTNTIAWTAVPGAGVATAISVCEDANLCVVLVGGQPLYRDATGGDSWQEFPSAPVALKSISVGMGFANLNQVAWAITGTGLIATFTFTNQSWTVSSTPADQIIATPDGSVYRLSGGALSSFDWAGSWTPIASPEKLTNIGAGVIGAIWGVGQSGTIYQYDGGAWISVPPPQGAGAGAQLSVGSDATVWLLANGAIYAYDPAGNDWDNVGWSAASHPAAISVSNAAQTWALDSAGAVWQYTEHVDQWQSIAGASLPVISQVSAQSAGSLWALDSAKAPCNLMLQNGQWVSQQIAGATLAAVSAGADGTVWGIDQKGSPFARVGSAWQPQPSPGQPLAAISVAGAKAIAAADTSGTAHLFAAGAWSSLPSPVGPIADLSITVDGAIFAVTSAGLAYMWINQWVPLCPGLRLKRISAAHPDEVWGITSAGLAIELTLGSSQLEQPAQQIGSGLRWDTENPFDEAQSTHLWIVNRGTQVARLQGPLGTKIYNLVKPGQGRIGDPFHDNLCQGLYDADFKSDYNQPISGVTTYMSHFYDPDSGLNWLGLPWPTALTQGRTFFQQALSSYKSGDLAHAGYYLGLSLHYFTDLTQPMHAANYTWLSSAPRWGYHTAFEGYIMEIQGTVTPPGTYVASNFGTSPDPYLVAAARNSKSKYYGNICNGWSNNWYWGYTDYYRGLARQNVGGMLTDAIRLTSQYLVAWAQATG